ncbi:MAG: transcriptional repressor [Anaerocolumna aminovalerica]|jgi:Fur family ferric uptake transcriptional regulator|uniref:Fur family transcriptional regulator n=1 Tax=Anaerocolumna aminovalerica TaxID=1527 RepID=UPI00248AA318|nr:transcriptional repressor [Anaerocolumna aminovalerica]MDU6264306.1 transcriptional repressor [Anaerocolumna aminovalerica]
MDKKVPLSHKLSRKERILEHLRANGFRITSQRRLLLDIILEDEYSSCKEIYYKAVKEDSSVGIATVYRMINTLEELGVINRNKLYNLEYDNLPASAEEEILFVDENTGKTIALKKGDWFEGLRRTLWEAGVQNLANLSIVVKNQKQRKENSYDGHVCKGCQCNKTNCKYHCRNSNLNLKSTENSKNIADSVCK